MTPGDPSHRPELPSIDELIDCWVEKHNSVGNIYYQLQQNYHDEMAQLAYFAKLDLHSNGKGLVGGKYILFDAKLKARNPKESTRKGTRIPHQGFSAAAPHYPTSQGDVAASNKYPCKSSEASVYDTRNRLWYRSCCRGQTTAGILRTCFTRRLSELSRTHEWQIQSGPEFWCVRYVHLSFNFHTLHASRRALLPSCRLLRSSSLLVFLTLV